MSEGVTNLDPDGAYFGPIALLAWINLSSTRIEQESGVQFERSLDDLGILDGAVFQTSSGIIAGMRCHEECVADRVELFVNLTTPHPQGWLVLAQDVLRELNLAGLSEVEVFDNPDD